MRPDGHLLQAERAGARRGFLPAGQGLVATADGLAMRVLMGGLSARAAERTLRAALDDAVA